MYESISMILISLVFALQLFVAIKFLRGRFGKIITVKARVVDKHTVESFSKYSGNGKHIRYVVVFRSMVRRRAFMFPNFPTAVTDCMNRGR